MAFLGRAHGSAEQVLGRAVDRMPANGEVAADQPEFTRLTVDSASARLQTVRWSTRQEPHQDGGKTGILAGCLVPALFSLCPRGPPNAFHPRRAGALVS